MKQAKRKCANLACRQEFIKRSTWQEVCGNPECALALIRQRKDKEAAKAKKETRLRDAARREAIKTIPELKKDAQQVFNAYIRFRDRDRPCICCGRPYPAAGLTGGAADAGHYRSTGSADHLRFHEDNCHGQRKDCNRYGAGRAVDYRIGLIDRIGLPRVEALEANNATIKWTREMLIEIRNTYRAKLKELEKARDERK